jgi:hypothetical protein
MRRRRQKRHFCKEQHQRTTVKKRKTYLHSADSHPQRPACRAVTLFALAFLLDCCGVHPILARTHLEIQHARALQAASKILHQNEVILPSNDIIRFLAMNGVMRPLEW